MFSRWRGTARSIAGRAWNRFRLLWLPLSRPRKIVFSIVALLLIAGIVGGGSYVVNYYLDTRPVGTPLPTPEQAMKDNLKELESQDPTSLTGKDKADYYNRLTVAQSDDKNYAAAAKALKTRIEADQANVQYYDYIQLAMYYHQAGDDKAALEALDTAAAVAPKTDDLDKGYIVEQITTKINNMRQEYSK